jgi:hypothetical protein
VYFKGWSGVQLPSAMGWRFLATIGALGWPANQGSQGFLAGEHASHGQRGFERKKGGSSDGGLPRRKAGNGSEGPDVTVTAVAADNSDSQSRHGGKHHRRRVHRHVCRVRSGCQLEGSLAYPNGEVAPFTGVGEPVRKDVWVENGVVKNLSYSRFWAERKGVPAKAGMSNFIMSGGEASTDDLIQSVARGVLITRFWYIRALNPRTLTQTGLTRDGTFLIENGRIGRPVTVRPRYLRVRLILELILALKAAMGPGVARAIPPAETGIRRRPRAAAVSRRAPWGS